MKVRVLPVQSNRILISGANGFVGKNLVEHLIASQNVQIIAGARNPNQDDWLSKIGKNERCDVVEFDLNAPDGMHSVLEKYRPTHVINCAAYGVAPGNDDGGVAFSVNVTAPLTMYKMCAQLGVQRFVQIGSCAEYGPKTGTISENSDLDPIGLYASTKAAASLLLLELAKTLPTQLLILRLFNTWGKYEPAHRLIPSLRKYTDNSQTIKLSKGTQVRDFSYVVQSVRAISELTLFEGEMPHKLFNIGTGCGISVRDFAERVAKELDISQQLDFGAIAMRANELPTQIADVTRLKKVLGQNIPQPINPEQIQEYLKSLRMMD